MTQTWAVFYDAYRNLNSKKLFWITLGLSGLVVLAFACIGINEKGVTVFTWELQHPFFNTNFVSPDYFYKTMFSNVGVNMWLSWIGVIMALVSTAGIFPDLMAEGAIDLAVSKPISRKRLFLTQYAAGLLFVGMQVTIFTVASFLIIGLRGGVWEPGLFIAIPLVLCLFSYLFSVCVLVGVKTRSAIAGIFLTLIFWCGLSVMNSADLVLSSMTASVEDNQQNDAMGFTSVQEKNSSQAQEVPQGFVIAQKIIHGVVTVLPKTSGTIYLLERNLIDMAELPEMPDEMGGGNTQEQVMIEQMRKQSPAWILGTSLGFEAIVLLLAGWIFCRRDY